ncbi:unnamed protein product [Soboliphyme baturini]|uniref:Porin n=1 Tax=Soboliphyme baturini TaxID=241478 RepID=A0A183J3M5_9BILA|nr:unnamed protein product [Soboliphyme baturini]
MKLRQESGLRKTDFCAISVLGNACARPVPSVSYWADVHGVHSGDFSRRYRISNLYFRGRRRLRLRNDGNSSGSRNVLNDYVGWSVDLRSSSSFACRFISSHFRIGDQGSVTSFVGRTERTREDDRVFALVGVMRRW